MCASGATTPIKASEADGMRLGGFGWTAAHVQQHMARKLRSTIKSLTTLLRAQEAGSAVRGLQGGVRDLRDPLQAALRTDAAAASAEEEEADSGDDGGM